MRTGDHVRTVVGGGAEAAAVEDLIYEYCDAMDLGDAARATEVFSEDAHMAVPGASDLQGVAAIGDWLLAEASRFPATAHHVSNVRTTRDESAGVWRVDSSWMLWRQDPAGEQERRYLQCRDEVGSDEAGYRIRRRRLVLRGVERGAGPTARHVLEVMATSRAVRRFRDEPVPYALVHQVLEAATWAPSPQNRQPWEFVALTQPASVAVVADAIAARGVELREMGARANHSERRKMFLDVAALIEALGAVPVVILVCGRPLQHDSPAGREAMLLSALYGASQNLLLAARALELGAVFTTLHVHGEGAIRAGLGIPDEVVIAGTIVLGWPDAPRGRVRRRPVDEVLHWQSW